MNAHGRNVVLLMADLTLQQWVLAVLRRSFNVSQTCPDAKKFLDPQICLVDTAMLNQHWDELKSFKEQKHQNIPVIILIDKDSENLSESMLALVDAVIPAMTEPAILRSKIRHWCDLRDSLRIWQRASNERELMPQPLTSSSVTAHIDEQPASNIDHSSTLKTAQASSPIQEMLKLCFDTSTQALFIFNQHGDLIAANPACTSVWGYQQEELVGHSARMLLPESVDLQLVDKFLMMLKKQHGWEGELRGQRKNGDIFPFWITMRSQPVESPIAGQQLYIGVVTDLSVSRLLEDSVLYLSQTDSLAELNKVLLEERLALDIRQAEQHQHHVVVFYINLRRFRALNDQHGYAFGDWVLMSQLNRLRDLVGTRGLVCRLYSNNFIVEMPDVESREEADELTQQIIRQLSQPLFYDQKEIVSLPIIGISMFPMHGHQPPELIRNADIAMDACRNQPGTFSRYFEKTFIDDMQHRISLEKQINLALEKNEFYLEYQPQLNLKENKIRAVEALIRWRSPQGIRTPKDFIPFAEANDLIIPISHWVLKEACRQAKTWHEQGLNMTISVNISASHFANELIVEHLYEVLNAYDLPAHLIEIEVTESCIMQEVERSIKTLNSLKALGVSLAVDDFGTGYSSLSYLKLFPLDILKIDKSFMNDVIYNNSDAVIVRAIIALGTAMGMQVVAEGVETLKQANLLRAWLCHTIQGYLVSHPVSENLIPKLVDELSGQTLKMFHEQKMQKSHVLLIVDDEPSIISALRRSLRNNDYQIITATSAIEALDLLAHHNVGVILSDNKMPGMSGIELLQQVKHRYPMITRIMLSGYADIASLSSAINSGETFRFLGKPWDEGELKTAIREGFMRFDDQCLLSQMSRQSTV